MTPYATIPISDLLATIRHRPDCTILPAAGQPRVRASDRVPDDMRGFYEICGGVTLFPHGAVPLTILPPARVGVANLIILGLDERTLFEKYNLPSDEPSWSWYTLALDGNGDYFVIDLSQARTGRCYDAHHETYPARGETNVIALTFTDFLARMLWLIETSPPPNHFWVDRMAKLRLGDAYE
jgi:antitoxin YokJ